MDAQLPTYSLGATGPAGGFVFYVTDDGLHGYEAAPVDQGFAEWGCNGTGSDVIAARGLRLGSGQHNTVHIVAEYLCLTTAADLADAYSVSGYGDWFLPSTDALELMYANLQLLGQGGFAAENYWSSSMTRTGVLVWHVNFGSLFGNPVASSITEYTGLTYRVRAVRVF